MQMLRILVAALGLLPGALAFAQTNTGEISGVVKDASGAVLPGATVTTKHPATGFSATRITDSEGRFFFAALRPASWDISAALQAFATQTRSNIPLEIGRNLGLEFTLAVGVVAQEITVDGSELLLNHYRS